MVSGWDSGLEIVGDCFGVAFLISVPLFFCGSNHSTELALGEHDVTGVPGSTAGDMTHKRDLLKKPTF